MPDNRLDPDINLLGYWGFDEALETDDAVDGATNFAPANLVVTSATSVQAGRVGAARQFNGSSGFASVTEARLRLTSETLFMGWINLTSVNGGASLLRTIMSCGGPTLGDNLLYALYVDSLGRLVYKHTAAAGIVIVRTAVATIKTGQFYCVMLRRSISGPDHNIEFFVDNTLIPVADVTVNAVASALPVPVPLANASAIFSVARSQKETDSAFWHGLIDEVSVHDVARAYQPYLRGAYYRVAIRNATSHLTSTNNVLSVSSTDMRAGVRWWCYERDRDLYVVKESPFGFFGADTRLTQIGAGALSSDVTAPELIYDVASDTLLVLFVSGNRIYKLTGQATDNPTPISMPATADAGGIVKSLENADGSGIGLGGGQRPVTPEDITYVNRTPVKIFDSDTTYDIGLGGGQFFAVTQNRSTPPTINFMELPSPDGFGVAVGPNDGTQSGYRIFRMEGGGSAILGNATLKAYGNFYFFTLPPPLVYGDVFYAEALRFGKPTGVFSNSVVYKGGEIFTASAVLYKIGTEGDGTDTANVGLGGGLLVNESLVYVNRTPVKISGQDAPAYDIGLGGGQQGRVNTTGSNRPGGLAIEVNL